MPLRHGAPRCLGCALAAGFLGAIAGTRLKSREHDVLNSPVLFSSAKSRPSLATSALLSFCDSEILGRLPYDSCLMALQFSGPGGVAIPNWNGGRLGNDVLQVMHAIVYAEALGLPEVILPAEGGHLGELFDMPSRLSIIPNPDLQRRVRCSLRASSDFFSGLPCQGIRRQDYKHAALRYFKPRLTSPARKACSSENEGFRGLTIHLRSGDLIGSAHKQGRFLPCAFHDLAIEAGGFEEVRVVTEPDMAHPCLAYLRQRHSDKVVHVQSRSIEEDACALMTAQHLEYGDSTFAQVLGLMNENVKSVSLPSELAGGAHNWYGVGTSQDPLGLLAHCKKENNTGNALFLYSVAGVKELRHGRDSLDFLLSTPANTLHRIRACTDSVDE